MKDQMHEFKIQTLRVCEDSPPSCKEATEVKTLWKTHVTTAQWFDPMKEAIVVFCLDTKLNCIGFTLAGLL